MKRPLALLISTGVAAFTLMAVLAVAAPRLGSAPSIAPAAPNVIYVTATPLPTTQIQSGGGEGPFVGSFGEEGEGGEHEGGEHQGVEVEFAGTVEAINLQSWTINGQMVWVTDRTKIKAGIQVGDFVKVHAVTGEDGALLAREIEAQD